jgi:hypothetical protein
MDATHINANPEDPAPLHATEAAAALKAHLLNQIAHHGVATAPFHHCFIEDIFPSFLHTLLIDYKRKIKADGAFQNRHQDGRTYINRRFRLINSDHPAARLVRQAFSDPEITRALLGKFYVNPDALTPRLSIHKEFEFVFCRRDLFQDIHIDIPPKVLSFVFYLPCHPVAAHEAKANATVLYDKQLQPAGEAKYQPNSVCIFAPHFYSYHGFSTTIERDVMVMFYVDKRELLRWESLLKLAPIHNFDSPPYALIKRSIGRKLKRFPLKEYGDEPSRIDEEMMQCLVNQPQGRALKPGQQS